MHERISDPVDNLPVQFGFASLHDEIYILALFMGKIPDRTAKGVKDGRKRLHAHLERGFLKIADEMILHERCIGHGPHRLAQGKLQGCAGFDQRGVAAITGSQLLCYSLQMSRRNTLHVTELPDMPPEPAML